MAEFATLYLEEIPAKDDEDEGVTAPLYSAENEAPGNAAPAAGAGKGKKKRRRRRAARKKKALQWSCRVLHPEKRPGGRGGASLVADGNEIYLFGGADRAAKHFGDLWRFDTVTSRWAQLRPEGEAPAARANHAMVRLGPHRLLLQGGADLQTEVNYDDVHLLDTEALRWTRVATVGAGPFGRSGHILARVAAGEVLVFGGSSPEEGPQNDMHRLRFTGEATAEWTKIEWDGAGPPERDLHAGCVVALHERRAHAATSTPPDLAEEELGANDEVQEDAVASLESEAETKSAEAAALDSGAPSAEDSRADAIEEEEAAESCGLCVFGGRGVMGNVFDDAWLFDVGVGSWTPLNAMPGPRCSAAACTLDAAGRQVVAMQGGWDGGMGIFGDLYVFSVQDRTWSSASISDVGRFGNAASCSSSGEDMYVFGGIHPADDLSDVLLVQAAATS